MGTVDNEIPAINQENVNKLQVAKLLEQFRNNQQGQDQPQSSYEQPTPMQEIMVRWVLTLDLLVMLYRIQT